MKILVVTQLAKAAIIGIAAIVLLAFPSSAGQTNILWQKDCPGSHFLVENDVITCYTDAAPPTVTPNPQTPAPPPPPVFGVFNDPLTGNPDHPEPFQSLFWDVTVHSRDTRYVLDSMMADHGDDCAGPPAVHLVDEYEEAVYRCRDHIMTSIEAAGYGVIYLTPSTLVDLSQEATISWRMSTARTSMDRDWIDVWITPFEDHLQLPLQGFLPDLQGLPRNGILIRLQGTRNSFEVFVIRDFVATSTGKGFTGYEQVLDPDRLRRDLFEINVSPDHIRVWLPEYGLTFVNREISPPLEWASGVVQFGHHSYNPNKDASCGGPCPGNSWHWDEFRIEPALPMTIISDLRRYYRPGENEAILASPTLDGGYLRFAGIGENLRFSVDDGQTWTPAIERPGSSPDDGHFTSYQTPIPAGASRILLDGGDWWGGPWHVRDLSVFIPQGE